MTQLGQFYHGWALPSVRHPDWRPVWHCTAQGFQCLKGIPRSLYNASSNKYRFKILFTECLSYCNHNEPVPPGAMHSVFIPLDCMMAMCSNNHARR